MSYPCSLFKRMSLECSQEMEHPLIESCFLLQGMHLFTLSELGSLRGLGETGRIR